jgi:hypothetical protein
MGGARVAVVSSASPGGGVAAHGKETVVSMKLELDDEQREVLVEALESELSELGDEIGHTDAEAYRDKLKHRRAVLHAVLARLQGAAVGT